MCLDIVLVFYCFEGCSDRCGLLYLDDERFLYVWYVVFKLYKNI